MPNPEKKIGRLNHSHWSDIVHILVDPHMGAEIKTVSRVSELIGKSNRITTP